MVIHRHAIEVVIFRPDKYYTSVLLVKNKIWSLPRLIFGKEPIDDVPEQVMEVIKLKTGTKPRVISIEPISENEIHETIDENPVIITTKVFCAIVEPGKSLLLSPELTEGEFMHPRKARRLLQRGIHEQDLEAALHWLEADDYAAEYLANNIMTLE